MLGLRPWPKRGDPREEPEEGLIYRPISYGKQIIIQISIHIRIWMDSVVRIEGRIHHRRGGCLGWWHDHYVVVLDVWPSLSSEYVQPYSEYGNDSGDDAGNHASARSA